jgi:hypothetical protein
MVFHHISFCFSFKERWEVLDFLDFFVASMFPSRCPPPFPPTAHKFSMCSHHFPQVPNVFLNIFLIAPHFVPYAFAKVVFLREI